MPADYPTIQEAINAATDGDEILVAPGIYGESIDFAGKAVQVRSSGGAGKIVTGTGDGVVVAVTSGEGAGTVLEGFTVTGGPSNDGAMRNVESSPLVKACVFVNNPGYAVHNIDSTFIAVNTLFEGNTLGMLNEESDVTVDGCMFKENLGLGGVSNNGSTFVATNTHFDGNEATVGAAISNTDSTVEIVDSVIVNSVTNHWSAAILNVNSVVTIANTEISQNDSWQQHGAISNMSGSTLTVHDSIITNNVISFSGGEGGGIYNAGALDVLGTRFCGNQPVHIFGPWTDLGSNQFGVSCPIGDMDGDGVVNVFDLLDLLGAWGDCEDDLYCEADLNTDGSVDVFDLLILLGNWG